LKNGHADIRIQPRTNKKSITTIEGLAHDLDLDSITKACKKTCNCNGSVIKDDVLGKVIQLQGDQRQKMKQFLIDEEICHRDNIKVHGF